jgi:hypothetical protein
MQGTPLTQLKREILQTLDDLNSGSWFYVIFFHATDVPMPAPNWLQATKENVDEVRPWIQNMKTKLKTKPASAFDRAFKKLDPRPDVIFFMTDGMLQENIPDRLAQLNATEPKVPVHTILFSKAKKKAKEGKFSKPAAQLRLIAEKNDGTFRQVAQE